MMLSLRRTLVRLDCVAAECEASCKPRTCFGALHLSVFWATSGAGKILTLPLFIPYLQTPAVGLSINFSVSGNLLQNEPNVQVSDTTKAS